MNKIYFGTRLITGETVVQVWEPGSLSKPLKHEAKHSPTGYEWGYLGSGPADLALSILMDCTGSRIASERMYHKFKQDFVAGFKTSWCISEDEIERWFIEQTIGEKDNVKRIKDKR